MPLADTISMVRSGMFQIAFANADRQKIGGGTAFLVGDFLITNNHVFAGHATAQSVGIRRDDTPDDQFDLMDAREFAKRLVSGSDQQSYDYAILNIPEVIGRQDHRFILETPNGRRIGEAVALLGFPLEHDNLTCHQGIISSFYNSGLASVIQLDASVNAGNSGGPLIDPETGTVIGIVTRKATGLSRLFGQLRRSIAENIAVASTAGGGIAIGGVDVVQAIIAGQNQMLMTLAEIERQANVGIGYAFSVEHILAEPCMQAQ